MIKIAVDKSSKIPLYLQIKDRYVYHISTGEIQLSEEMPKLMDLSKNLGISYETARRAYRELEREGLIAISRGKRTIVSPSGIRKDAYSPDIPMSGNQLAEAQKRLLRAFIQNHMSPQEIKELIADQLRDILEEKKGFFIIFCECSQYQTKNISKILEAELGVRVMPVVLDDLAKELQKTKGNRQLLAIITTGFHLKAVHDLIGDTSIEVYAISIHMSAQSRRVLYSYDKNARFGIICRDEASIEIYEAILKNEMVEAGLNISSCAFNDKKRVREIVDSVDVLLVTPPIFNQIKPILPPGLPVLNMFDQVDAMSLNIIKEQIQKKNLMILPA
jgi:DNA-binding transcriptional regulator YhcF (GntR family)